MQQEQVTAIALGLLTVAVLSGVYWLNLPDPEPEEDYGDLLKSAICIYALQGIVSDYHYHLWLNITANGERVEYQQISASNTMTMAAFCSSIQSIHTMIRDRFTSKPLLMRR